MLEEDRTAICGPRYAHEAASQAPFTDILGLVARVLAIQGAKAACSERPV
jgi:hypothetical protein